MAMTDTPDDAALRKMAQKSPPPWERRCLLNANMARFLDAEGGGIAIAEAGSNNDVLWSGIVIAVNAALLSKLDAPPKCAGCGGANWQCFDCGVVTAPPKGVTLTGADSVFVEQLRSDIMISRAENISGEPLEAVARGLMDRFAEALAIIDRLTATAPGKVRESKHRFCKVAGCMTAIPVSFEYCDEHRPTEFKSAAPKDIAYPDREERWPQTKFAEEALDKMRDALALPATAPGKAASLADIYAKLRSSLYAKTKRDWQLTVHVTLTEPTCPTVVINEEGGKSSRYRFDRDTIEEGVAAAVDAVYREVILGEKVAPECPWTDASPSSASSSPRPQRKY